MKAHAPETRRAFLVTLVAAILNILGTLVDLLFWRSRMHATPVWHLVSIAMSAGLIGLVMVYRPTGRQWIASLAFVINNGVSELAIWRASTPLALGMLQWAPFQAEKLGALAVAVLAPPSLWAGVVSIGIFVGSAMAHWASFDTTVRARMLGEPWATIAYGVFALLLYAYRLHAVHVERTMADSLAAKRTTEHVSRMLLAVRGFLEYTPADALSDGRAAPRPPR